MESSAAVSAETDLMVTLTVVSHPVAHAERTLRLTRESQIIHIGRASKTATKGRVASDGNGLFDSPVMSRDHAELVADVDAKTLSVKDIGSTHGTFVNGFAIPPNEPQPLKAGDKLRFGVAINRDKDSFTPVIVDLGMEFAQRRAPVPVTFSVPDESDSDGEDMQTEHIDLTQQPEVAYVDLTSEPEQSEQSEQSEQPEQSPSAARRESAPTEVTYGQVSVANSALDSFLGALGDRPSSLPPNDEASSIWLTDEEDLEHYDPSDIGSDEQNYSGGDSDQDSDLGTSGEDGSDLDSEMEDSGSEVHDVFLWDEADSDADDMESESDNKDNDGYVPYSFSPILSAPIGMIDSTNPSPLGPSDPPTQTQTEVVPPTQTQTELGPSSIAAREPSPSDAALFIRKPTASVTSTSPEFSHTVQEFHAARQANKEKAASTGTSDWTTGQPQSICSFTAPSYSVPEHTACDQVGIPCSFTQPPFLRTATGPFSSLLNDAGMSAFVYEQRKRAAIAMQRRAAENGAAPGTGTESAFEAIRPDELAPSDELPSEAPAHSQEPVPSEEPDRSEAQPKKRKADEMSETTAEELGAMGGGEAVPQNEEPTPLKDRHVSPELTTPAAPEQLRIVLQECPRPAKRLRTFVGRMGIAALSGITVGAVVFGSLAATCPTF